MLNPSSTSSAYFTSLLETISPTLLSLPLSLSLSLFPLIYLPDTDVYCVHDVDSVLDLSLPRDIGSVPLRGFTWLGSLDSYRYNNSSHAIDTRYSLPPRLPRVPDRLSRFTSPFLLAFTGLSAAAARDDIYHQSLINSLRRQIAPHVSTSDPPPVTNPVCGVSPRRGDQASQIFPPTGGRLLSSLSCHCNRCHIVDVTLGRGVINGVTLPRFCAHSYLVEYVVVPFLPAASSIQDSSFTLTGRFERFNPFAASRRAFRYFRIQQAIYTWG